MAQFSYTAVNKKGGTVTGTIEGTSKEAVAQAITKLGQRPILIKPIKVRSGFSLKLEIMNRVKSKDLVIFTRQLATMVNAGIPLVRTIATLQAETRSKFLKDTLGQVTKDVESGIAFADALERHPKVFSEVYINMIRAGEAGGILDDILKKLAGQIEKEASIKKKLHSAMMYPSVLLSITVVAFFGLTIFVIPKLGEIIHNLAGEDATLPLQTRILLNISGSIRAYWIIWLPILVGVIFGIRAYLKTKKGHRNYHKILLKTPIIKTVVSKIAIARFARTFASLMSAGVTVLDSLHVTSRAVGNIIIQEELEKASEAVKNGEQLSEPLSKSKFFPPMVSQMLSVGEETGQTDTILIKVADFYEEEVDAFVSGISSIIEPLMIVVLGTIVGIIAASVMGPISNLANQI